MAIELIFPPRKSERRLCDTDDDDEDDSNGYRKRFISCERLCVRCLISKYVASLLDGAAVAHTVSENVLILAGIGPFFLRFNFEPNHFVRFLS